GDLRGQRLRCEAIAIAAGRAAVGPATATRAAAATTGAATAGAATAGAAASSGSSVWRRAGSGIRGWGRPGIDCWPGSASDRCRLLLVVAGHTDSPREQASEEAGNWMHVVSPARRCAREP